MVNKFDSRNMSMALDKYELTMANAYFRDGRLDERVVFDVFYRKNPDGGGFSILAGVLPAIDFIDNFGFNDDDIAYLKSQKCFDDNFLDYIKDNKFDIKVTGLYEGTIVYPNTPLMTIEAPIIFAQMLETYILTLINHGCLIATKANRFVRAANGRPIADFGARRAHGGDAAVYGARSASIGGVAATATVMSGEIWPDIPITGTMAHSWVQSYSSELEAFKKFADYEPNNCVLLIDTIDTLKSGVINAIKTFDYLKEKNNGAIPGNYGIRIDSGDLAYLSKEVRKKLNDAGYKDAKIVVSNSLTEQIIRSLLDEQNAPIDSFGVGENLITAKSDAVFGAVYKLVGVIDSEGNVIPKIKISNNVEKITNPGRKNLFRIYGPDNYAIGDVITDQYNVDENTVCILPEKHWIHQTFKGLNIEKLTKVIYERKNGKKIHDVRGILDLKQIRRFVKNQIDNFVYPEVLRFENPYSYPVYMEDSYYNMKMDLLKSSMGVK